MSRRHGGALAKKAKAYPSLVVREITQLEADLGGRAGVLGLLVMAPLTADLEYFLGLLGDPMNEPKSLAEICAMAEILPGELLHRLQGAAVQLGKVRVAQQVAMGLQPVVADLLRRAAPYEEDCHECLATGRITPEPTAANPNPTHEPCDTCKGSGRLRYSPDLERQKLVFELGQLLPKGGGVQINNNQNVLNASGGAAGVGLLDRVQQIADAALYGADRVLPLLDAEPLEENNASTDTPEVDGV